MIALLWGVFCPLPLLVFLVLVFRLFPPSWLCFIGACNCSIAPTLPCFGALGRSGSRQTQETLCKSDVQSQSESTSAASPNWLSSTAFAVQITFAVRGDAPRIGHVEQPVAVATRGITYPCWHCAAPKNCPFRCWSYSSWHCRDAKKTELGCDQSDPGVAQTVQNLLKGDVDDVRPEFNFNLPAVTLHSMCHSGGY